MVGTDLKNTINNVLGETPDRQIISEYIQWRKSPEGEEKKESWKRLRKKSAAGMSRQSWA